jgi:hypothetical protein
VAARAHGADDARHEALRGRARAPVGARGDARPLGGGAGRAARDRIHRGRPARCAPVAGRRRCVVGRSALPERLHAYAEKAAREGDVGTSWTDPDEAFEARVHGSSTPRSMPRGRRSRRSSPTSWMPAARTPSRRSCCSSPARRAGRLPGHGAVGPLARRPRQPAPRRLSPSAARCSPARRRVDAVGRRHRRRQAPRRVADCGCAATGPTCSRGTRRWSRRRGIRARRRVRPGRCDRRRDASARRARRARRLGRHRGDAPRGSVARRSPDARSPAGRALPSCSPTCRSRCWSRPTDRSARTGSGPRLAARRLLNDRERASPVVERAQRVAGCV